MSEAYEQVNARLEEIIGEVNREDIDLEEALKLYEEAVKLGSRLSELVAADIDVKEGLNQEKQENQKNSENPENPENPASESAQASV